MSSQYQEGKVTSVIARVLSLFASIQVSISAADDTLPAAARPLRP